MKSLYDNEMRLEFLSKSNNEAFARISVAAFASQLDPTVEELADIKTAVSEAVTNSIIHGYEDKEGTIEIICKIFANTIVIEISDKGKGIEIMESFMDDLEVESILELGTKVTMKKVIQKKDKKEDNEGKIFSSFRI